jgi:hypothetical protein
MYSKRSPGLAPAIVGLLALLGASTPALAQAVDVRTNRGCGSQAVYQAGEIVQIFVRSSQTASAQLLLTRPDGTSSFLFNGVTLQGGVTYVVNGSMGTDTRTRTLTFTAGTASATCTFSGGTTTPPPPTGQAQRVPGILNFQNTQDPIVAPTTAQVNVPFQMTITTYGSGCEEKGDEGVIITDTGASVFLYDFTTATRPGVVCTTILKRFQHTVTLSFPTPGEKVIRVWGRGETPGAPPTGAPVILEHRVFVQ